MRDSARAIGTLLAAGLALRLIIAYLLPGSGFKVDLGAFEYWAHNLAQQGPTGFYDRGFFADYTPGYLYVLWLVGLAGDALKAVGVDTVGPWTFTDLMKLPSVLADLAIGWLIYRMVLDLGASRRRALLGAALYVFNPITWFDSVIWGQVDSFGVVFLLLGVRELWHDRPERAAVWTTVAAVIKPQLGILVPIVATVVIRRYLFDSPEHGQSRWVRWTATGVGPDVGPDVGPGGAPAHVGVLGRLRLWGARERGPTRVVTTATAGLATAVVLALPFGLTILDLLTKVATTAGGYPYLTVNAYNPWALLTQNGNGLAANSLWIRDVNGPDPADVGFAFGPVPAVLVGSLLIIAAVVLTCWVVARRPDRITILVGTCVLALAFFVLPTRVHERYLFPFFGLGAILAAVSVRWRLAYVLLALATFLNMYVVLTTLYPDNPQISDWLGIGPDIRSATTITIVALIHLGGFLWIAAQLRRRSEARLVAEIVATRRQDGGFVGTPQPGLPEVDESVVPGVAALMGVVAVTGTGVPAATTGADGALAPDLGPGAGVGLAAAHGPGTIALSSDTATAAAAVAAANATADDLAWAPAPGLGQPRRRSWSDPVPASARGPWNAFRRAVLARPFRADRTASLTGERGGRLDRLDVWFLIVLVVSALTLRTFRLAEPYSMHFDEVYHARTATEFLQDWRYGIPHDIYEYTHPHLAKYFMAAGLVAFGDNQVTSQGNLGVPVKGTAIETRWSNAELPGEHAGDRVYVATGSDVRAYDLETRVLVATIAIPGAVTLGMDQAAHRLYVGSEDGTVSSVDTTRLDPLRANPASPTTGPPADPFGKVAGTPLDILVPTSGTTVLVATTSDDLFTLDQAGSQVAKTHLANVRQLVQAGSTQQVVAQPSLLTDKKAAASLLAPMLGKQASDIEARLSSSADTVLLGPPPTASARANLDQAVANGTLPGVNVQSLPQVAAVTSAGLTFLIPTNGTVTSQLSIPGASGAAYVTGLDAPRIYVAAGAKAPIVRLANDQNPTTGPFVESTITPPGQVQQVAFDPSTTFVNLIGRTPDGASPTAYQVETHGNAVFADARLPFEPASFEVDASPDYPSIDRQDLLLFSAAGDVATVDIGNDPFAWRLPGVILGAFTAGLLYLLARILFRRRAVAVFVGILCLADGMAFVQSRIGMNDVYVGFFIVAAYTLFAALWTGAIRRRWAFWVAMPAIGILLGLALASKWVGLYAMAGIGILILARSALGRLIIIGGMIGASTALGYMGLNVPAGASSGGNLTFMLIMIGLTMAAVAIAVLHPVAWSVEEVRFAIGAPPALGILLILVALPLGKMSASITLGPLKVTPLTAGLALVLLGVVIAAGFWVAGRLGFGPMAPPLPPEVAARVPAASPAPSGWLRLGSGFGIPAIWMAGTLIALPIVVYVISYLPWVALGNRLTETWPPNNHGQTLLQLTQSMYDYHNNLRAPHAASSPWWAWPLDLKPVWFYQGSFADGTAASIYDAGNLVIWWLGLPAMIFCAWQAYRRRSLGLALIVLGFAWQWLPWSRIDRATFQYHYYTSVPFLILALAYLLGELWHGPSKRTWIVMKAMAALAIIGPAIMWVAKGPVCRFVRVEAVNPGSQACVGNPGDLVVTMRVALLVLVLGVAAIALIYQLLRLNTPGAGRGGSGDGGSASGGVGSASGGGVGSASGVGSGPSDPPSARRRSAPPYGLLAIALTAVLAGLGIAIVDRVSASSVLFEIRGFQSTYLALLLALPLLLIAGFVLTARDSRRFTAATVFVIIVAFLVLYPNISALPLPSTVVNAYQGLLPTYLYPFQFPVNTDPAAPSIKLFALEPAILFLALTVTCVVVGYAAWVWRIGPADRTSDDDRVSAAGSA